MTLCTAWIRHTDDSDELYFATDSCLSGGERWKHGVKLFELPRKDCLICFAGETERTYPLILNLISSIKFDKHLSRPQTDITEVLDYLVGLFTELCNSIEGYGTRDFSTVLGDFRFLFGGWSWKSNNFRVWEITYKHLISSISHDEVSADKMFSVFIGDNIDVANKILDEELVKSGKIRNRYYDMEPLKVLNSMISKSEYDSIDGSIQLAKIQAPGNVEFIGVTYRGQKHFLGKKVDVRNIPNVSYIDPDNCELIEDEIPISIKGIDKNLFVHDIDFIESCYPDDNLLEIVTEQQKRYLTEIFASVAHRHLIQSIKKYNLSHTEEATIEEEQL